MSTDPTTTGIPEFFDGLAGHLKRRLRQGYSADGRELEVGDGVRYHGSLERHHGFYVVLDTGEFADDPVTLGRQGAAVLTCNKTSVTTAKVCRLCEAGEARTLTIQGRRRSASCQGCADLLIPLIG